MRAKEFSAVDPSDTERNLAEQSQIGAQARDLYDHPLVQRFLKETEDAIVTGIKTTRPDEYEKREDMYRALKMVDSFKAMLMHYLERGKAAENMLADLKAGVFDGI